MRDTLLDTFRTNIIYIIKQEGIQIEYPLYKKGGLRTGKLNTDKILESKSEPASVSTKGTVIPVYPVVTGFSTYKNLLSYIEVNSASSGKT